MTANTKEKPLLDQSRGEFPLQIGDVHLGIAVTFTGLIKASKAVGAATMPDLQKRLVGGEPWTMAVGIKVFSVDPDGPDAARERAEAALSVLSVADTNDWVTAISLAIAHHTQTGLQKRGAPDDDLVAQVLADLEPDGGDDNAGKPKAAPPQ